MSKTNRPDGLVQLQAMLAADRRTPIGETLNFHLIEVERGRAVFEGTPDRSVYNPLGAVHGGYAATLLDSACAIAAYPTLGPGRGHTTLEPKISYLRGLCADSGTVRATATSTLLVFDVEPGAREAVASTGGDR